MLSCFLFACWLCCFACCHGFQGGIHKNALLLGWSFDTPRNWRNHEIYFHVYVIYDWSVFATSSKTTYNEHILLQKANNTKTHYGCFFSSSRLYERQDAEESGSPEFDCSGISGVMTHDPFSGDIKQCKCMVNLRDFPGIMLHCLGWCHVMTLVWSRFDPMGFPWFFSALFGLVSYFMTPDNQRFFSS